MLNQLAKIANKLDEKGFYTEANDIDSLIKTANDQDIQQVIEYYAENVGQEAQGPGTYGFETFKQWIGLFHDFLSGNNKFTIEHFTQYLNEHKDYLIRLFEHYFVNGPNEFSYRGLNKQQQINELLLAYNSIFNENSVEKAQQRIIENDARFEQWKQRNKALVEYIETRPIGTEINFKSIAKNRQQTIDKILDEWSKTSDHVRKKQLEDLLRKIIK